MTYRRGGQFQVDGYDFGPDEDSDPCYATDSSSSDDMIDKLLHGGTETVRRKSRKCLAKRKQTKRSNEILVGDEATESSEEDEFEREMSREMDDVVRKLERRRSKSTDGSSASPRAAPKGILASASPRGGSRVAGSAVSSATITDVDMKPVEGKKPKKKKKEYVDGEMDFFTSSDEDDDRPVDPFYDPLADDADEAWVSTRRRRQWGRGKAGPRLPQTDAVLSCPACMVTLCRDCQRHATNEHQYRAMFVSEFCSVDYTERLECPRVGGGARKAAAARKRRADDSENKENTAVGEKPKLPSKLVSKPRGEEPKISTVRSEDLFYPVKCSECKTQVGVLDNEEVYHFFHCLTSYG